MRLGGPGRTRRQRKLLVSQAAKRSRSDLSGSTGNSPARSTSGRVRISVWWPLLPPRDLRTSPSGRTRRNSFRRRGGVAVPPASFDLVVSVLTLHAVNDLPGALLQRYDVYLRPGGLFLGWTLRRGDAPASCGGFCGGEVETSGGASPRVAPLRRCARHGRAPSARRICRAGSRSGTYQVRYRSLATLVDDLRAIGETNSLAGRRRRTLALATAR